MDQNLNSEQMEVSQVVKTQNQVDESVDVVEELLENRNNPRYDNPKTSK